MKSKKQNNEKYNNTFPSHYFGFVFFSQLQEVNAQDLSSTENLSSNPSLQTSELPETIVVYMMHLA